MAFRRRPHAVPGDTTHPAGQDVSRADDAAAADTFWSASEEGACWNDVARLQASRNDHALRSIECVPQARSSPIAAPGSMIKSSCDSPGRSWLRSSRDWTSTSSWTTHQNTASAQIAREEPSGALPLTPTSASWLNLVERFFGEPTQLRSGDWLSPASESLRLQSKRTSATGTTTRSRSSGLRPFNRSLDTIRLPWQHYTS
jgi:hypothetical protein